MSSLNKLIIAVLCVISMVSLGASEVRKINLDTNFTLSYEVRNNLIDFVIEAKTKGWVAIGFNARNASMFDSDMFMGYVDGTNRAGGDYYVALNATQRTPQLDPSNPTGQPWGHWTVINGTETNATQNGQNVTTTKMAIRRNLNTNDQYDKPITNATINLIWSYNKDNDDRTVPHTARGSRAVNFLTGAGDDSGTTTTPRTSSTTKGGAAIISVGASTLLMAMMAVILKSG